MVLVAVENPARPAATVLVLRDSPMGPEVFMVRRMEGAAFSGAHVFPGGRVDAGDCGVADASWCDGIEEAERQLSDLDPAEAVGYHVAAARELFEEAGVLLARAEPPHFVSLAGAADHARFRQYRRDVHSGARTLREIVDREGLRLALDALTVYAHWVTPPVDSRRFDTRFFVARVPPDQTPAHDETETTHSAWIAPSSAIEAALRKQIVLPPPTWTTLRELEPFETVEDALAWSRARRIRRREPLLVEQNGQRMLVMPGDPAHPEPGATTVPRDARFVWTTDRWLPGSVENER
jgi:8-oxo-dGTP pyrophosphatase MutT (NUDIX family)